MSTPPIGRAFAAGCVATASAMLHLYALPYALSVPGQVFSGSAHMSALWVTGALTHCGSAVQAWFSYALQAWEAGLFFSGAGSANPFFVPTQTTLPPVQTLCYFAINAGFWLPAGAAILTLLYPEWTSHLPDDAFFLCNCARGFGGASNRGQGTMGGWNKSLRHISVGSKEPDVAEILNSRRRRSLRMQANPMQARKK
ncbi:unnamed protein product [Symbiodinium sp. KB8]|nr:unnamed protein product [Symbiodinium sp. KB8]